MTVLSRSAVVIGIFATLLRDLAIGVQDVFAASLLPSEFLGLQHPGSALAGIKENLVNHKKVLTKIKHW
jgi:hypothetical protein